MKEGNKKCEWCLNHCSIDDLDCPQCGGPILVLEPWVLQCGWCTSSNRRDLTTTCIKCGGPLPHIPGTPRLSRPPIEPRSLPKGYENRIKYWKNVPFLIGAIFVLMIPTIIFPIVGFFFLRYGIRRGNNQIFALKHGTPTRGVIQNVYIDTSQHINNINPVRIDYEFNITNKDLYGHVIVWDRTNLKRPSGEHIWILFNPKNVKQNSIWPPLS